MSNGGVRGGRGSCSFTRSASDRRAATRGVGTALVQAMRQWMRDEDVTEAWVLADNSGAEAFYAACGFVRNDEQPVQMTLVLEA